MRFALEISPEVLFSASSIPPTETLVHSTRVHEARATSSSKKKTRLIEGLLHRLSSKLPVSSWRKPGLSSMFENLRHGAIRPNHYPLAVGQCRCHEDDHLRGQHKRKGSMPRLTDEFNIY